MAGSIPPSVTYSHAGNAGFESPQGHRRCSVVTDAGQVPVEGRRFRNAEMAGSNPAAGSMSHSRKDAVF